MIPYTVERRADTGVTNVTMAIWLFLASEVMLFGALFSAYALLRVSALQWPQGHLVLNVKIGVINTLVLMTLTTVVWRARSAPPAGRRLWLLASMCAALIFLTLKSVEYRGEIAAGLVPSTNTFFALYFTLTGLHALHVIGGLAANVWVFAGENRVDAAMTVGRMRAIALYWAFVDLVWFVILGLFYFS